MEEQENISNMDSEPFHMEACRICLATDVKMYSLSDPYLAGCMKEIGLNDESRQWLPKFICYECRPTLLKCNQFIEKSKVVQDILCGLYSNSKVIIKEIIKEQHRLHTKLQSPLKCYLLQDYFYITHDDDDSALNNDAPPFPVPLKEEPVEKESVGNEPVEKEPVEKEIGLMEIFAQYGPMRLISPIIDPDPEPLSPPKELEDGQTLETIDAPTEEVQYSPAPVPEETVDDKDVDVVTIEDDVPVVEILSDEEKTANDSQPDSNADDLMYFDVDRDARCSKSFVANPLVRHRYTHVPIKKRIALSDIPIPKSRKKKKKKHKEREEIEDEDCVKKTFRIEVIKMKDRSDKKYTCKFCTKTYAYGDEAKDHYLLGCPQRHRNHSSTSLTASSGVKTWQDWPGSS